MSNPFRNRRRNAAFAAVLLAGTALGGVATGWAPAFAEGAVQAPQGGQIQPAAAVVAPAMQGLPGFADLVAKVRPAVVTIIQAVCIWDADTPALTPTSAICCAVVAAERPALTVASDMPSAATR